MSGQDDNDAFWRRKIAEADAAGGPVNVRLGDIPKVPGASAAFVLPRQDVTRGRKVILDCHGQVITETSEDVVLTLTVWSPAGRQ